MTLKMKLPMIFRLLKTVREEVTESHGQEAAGIRATSDGRRPPPYVKGAASCC
jgi:hypothetical protein